MANASLHAAKDAKNDEFYTRLEDINEELNHYEDKFRGKVVLCNCDDPKWSNFWKYFHMNFEYLGLKKLITTHYESGEVQSYKIEYTGGNDEDFEEGTITPLEQNGDFRSDECIALLDEADIVVTNPPFSLFREYVAQLIEHNKEFLIIGNMNAAHYKEIFPLLKDNKVWFGLTAPKEFYQPDGTVKKFGNIHWYTNIDHNKRHIWHETTYFYSKKDSLYPELYPQYVNFDAIDVGRISEIPMDYDGNMGVPDTFLQIYNPEQFVIVGLAESSLGVEIGFSANLTEQQLRDIKKENKSFRQGNPIYRDLDGKLKKPFSRIIIHKKAGTNNGK